MPTVSKSLRGRNSPLIRFANAKEPRVALLRTLSRRIHAATTRTDVLQRRLRRGRAPAVCRCPSRRGEDLRTVRHTFHGRTEATAYRALLFAFVPREGALAAVSSTVCCRWFEASTEDAVPPDHAQRQKGARTPLRHGAAPWSPT